ncbi:MAG: GNAT family N-acetyltransferase [Telluria sp.]
MSNLFNHESGVTNMGTALNIRRATLSDSEAIYRVHRDSVEQLCGAHYDARQLAMWLDGRTPAVYQAAIDRGQLWVAERHNIIGFVEIDGDELSKLFIAGAHSGQGVGTRLLCVAMDAITAGGAAQAHLEATVGAVPFYERHGFHITGTGFFSRGNGLVRIEIVKMARPCTATSSDRSNA